MKIDSFYCHKPSTQLTSHAFEKDSDFEQLLGEQTSHESGDTFYWHHLEQLQQSELTFESLPQSRHQSVNISNHIRCVSDEGLKNASTDRYPIPTEETRSDSIHIIKNPLQARVTIQNPLDNNGDNGFISTACHTQEVSLKPKPVQPRDILNSIDRKEVFNPYLKNHHLFIENQQAELTCNTQDWDVHEVKEFIKTIKDVLKNKKIGLSKLTINGVQHDLTS